MSAPTSRSVWGCRPFCASFAWPSQLRLFLITGAAAAASAWRWASTAERILSIQIPSLAIWLPALPPRRGCPLTWLKPAWWRPMTPQPCASKIGLPELPGSVGAV